MTRFQFKKKMGKQGRKGGKKEKRKEKDGRKKNESQDRFYLFLRGISKIICSKS